VYFGIDIGQPPASPALMRVATSGGPIVTLWSSDRQIHGVTSDACNAYWIAGTSFSQSLPPEILAQRR
jgi:hypothetical protein